MDSVVLQTARRAGARTACVGALALALGVGVATALPGPGLGAHLLGTTAPSTPLLHVVSADALDGRAVRVDFDRVIPIAGRGGGEERSEVFGLGFVDGTPIVVRSERASTAVHLSGTLRRTDRSSVTRGFGARLGELVPDLQARLSPVYLDARPRPVGALRLAALLALAGLLAGARLLLVGLRTVTQPLRGSWVRRLARLGPDALVGVEATMADPHVPLVGRVHVGPAWIVEQRPYAIRAIRTSELTWCHALDTSSTFAARRDLLRSAFRRTGEQGGELVLYGRDLRPLRIHGRVDRCFSAVRLLADRVPAPFYGYDAELAQQWRKDRAAVIRAVQERRDRGVPSTMDAPR